MSYGYDVIQPGSSNPYLIVVVPKSEKPVSVSARGYRLMCNPQVHYSVMQEAPEKAR